MDSSAPAVPVTSVDYNSTSNYQGIFIIILVIIGIILFIYLLVEFVNVPGPVIAPFADGSVIRIKSLGNNKYLRPVSCSDLRCNSGPVCSDSSRYEPVVANAIESDQNIDWILCQYKGPLPTAITEAAYMVYSGSVVNSATSNMVLQSNNAVGIFPLTVDNNSSICPTAASISLNSTCQSTNGNLVERYYLNFILEESAVNPAQSSSFNQNGTYQIRFINPNDFGLNCGTGLNATYLYNGIQSPDPCQNIVQLLDIDDINHDRNDIKEKLNYAFFIQVVKKG